ncbi:MAG TPA: alpha/beta hydrolase-fold protein [Candidatus Dormibacteraeota bacterium]|nr:alpha/beta hydrolase-fold protein [Candidatus Dormibacteraeota bacterium]
MLTTSVTKTDMQRDYIKEYSPNLGRDMELVHFGHAGRTLLVFPTSQGRFYQWEDFGLVGGISDFIESGAVQLVCLDSVDSDSWYARHKAPADRVRRHLQYENYILQEILPRLAGPPVACGASFGALHAVLLAARHPSRIGGFIALSGAYDTSRWLDGYHDDGVYFTNLVEFLPGLNDEAYLGPLRAEHPKVIATGENDPNVEESRRVAGLLRDKGVDVGLEIWPGWAHDWPYWKEMMRRYLAS